MSKVLLETNFVDSLGENFFDVKIVRHEGNFVFGDKVEVDIRHPEEDFIRTYQPDTFPEKFYKDLEDFGWDYVLDAIKEKICL